MPAGGFPDTHQCNQNSDCVSSSFCDCTACGVSSGTCKKKLVDLTDCNDDEACTSGNCETIGLVGDRQCRPADGFPVTHQWFGLTGTFFFNLETKKIKKEKKKEQEKERNKKEIINVLATNPPRHQLNENSNEDIDCKAGLFCDSSVCFLDPGTCETELSDNSKCSDDQSWCV